MPIALTNRFSRKGIWAVLLIIPWIFAFSTPPGKDSQNLLTDHQSSPYVCPPCGLNCDQLSYQSSGRCPVCLMALITATSVNSYESGPLQKLRKQGVFNFIIGLGIVQGFFMLFLLVFGKRGSRYYANRYLSLLIVGIISGCCYYLLLEYRVFYQYPVLSMLPLKMFFLIGPSLYLYVSSAIGLFGQQRRVWLHYLPAIIVLLVSVSMIIINLSPTSRAYAMYDLYVLGFAGQLHVLTYSVLTYSLLRRYRAELNDNLSQITEDYSHWLRSLIVFVFLLLGLISIYVLLSLVSPGLLIGRYLFLFWIFASVFVYWISLTVYQKPELFQLQEEQSTHQIQLPASEILNPYLEALRLSMEKDKLYLQPDLTRRTLADHVKINPNTLSLILNKHLKKSFHDYVNEYRVNEVKYKMADPDFLHYTLEGMAYESGFNSKSTFHAIFKKFSGKTPRQYKKEVAPV